MKEPDLAFVPLIGPDWIESAAFPSVVLETAYSESSLGLSKDGELWCQGSSLLVKVVILVKFGVPKRQNRRMKVTLTIGRCFPDINGDTTHFQDYASFSSIFVLPLSLLT